MPSDMEVLKEKIGELGTTVKEFKDANNVRLKLLEEKKPVDPLIEQKVDKANEQIDKIGDQIKSLETAINRKAVAPVIDIKLQEKYMQYKGVQSHLFKDGNFDFEADAKYKAAFNTWLQRGQELMTVEDSKALSVGSDPDGGFTVRPEVGEMIKTIEFETSPFRQWMSSLQISTDAFEFPTDGDEIAINWVGETQARPSTGTSKIGLRRIPIHELTASPKATQKLLDDSSINQEQFLSTKAAQKFTREEALQFANGDGVAKPRGFLTYPAGTTGDGDIEQVNSGSAGAVSEDGLVLLEAALKQVYRNNANWFMARATISEVRKLKDGQGRFIWQPGLQLGSPNTILGYPVVEATDMPAVAADSLSIALGDFKMGYKIIDRIGIRVLRDPFTDKPFVVFDYTKRVGGDVVVFEAIKLQKLSA